MSVTLWEPFHQRGTFDSLVDDFFGRRVGDWNADVPRVWRPAADVLAGEEGYRFYVDIPGVTADAIEIDVEDGVLIVSGERASGDESKETRYRRELRRGRFERAFRLPSDADTGSIAADYKNGVLEVRVPKVAEARARKIPIGSA